MRMVVPVLTHQLEVMIPKEVTTVRALPSAFGAAQVKTDDAGLVTSVVWAKAKDQVHPQDDMYDQMSIRIAAPNTPFMTLLFPALQSCRAADGTESTVEGNNSLDEVKAAGVGEDVPPSPLLTLLPVRQSGWNKFTVTDELDDLSVFNDAQIVWSGDAAYSSNTATTESIGQTAGVGVLSKIEAGARFGSDTDGHRAFMRPRGTVGSHLRLLGRESESVARSCR